MNMKALFSLLAVSAALLAQFTGCASNPEALSRNSEEQSQSTGDYLVIAFRGNPRADCRVVHKTSLIPDNRMIVFGPASYDDCDHWLMTHCYRR